MGASHMKSAIQENNEKNNLLTKFKLSLIELCDAYIVEESVFGMVGGTPTELMSGYFEAEAEYNSLDDALTDMHELDECIYIVSPEQVLRGTYKSNLSECREDKPVVDIDTLEKIR